ncbi:hypothetical protein JCM11491_000925 [Sporobolomyces phaffii]
MDLLDLTLSSDDEVPLQPSTSRSLHPTSTSHPSVRLKSGSNTSQGINSGARGSKARPSGRGSVNEHSSTPAGSSRTQTTDNRKGNQRVDIELSSDDDDDHFGGANSSATRRPLPRAQNGRLSAQSVTEIILPSDTESDSDAPTPLHRAPRWSSSSARHQPPASKNELEQTRGTARRASKTSSAGTALDNHAAKTSSASLRSPELQRDPTSINRGEDEGAGGRFKGGGAASASRAATSNLSPSVERHSGSPAPEASTSAAATILPQVTPSPKAAPHGVATAFTVKSGKGKEKAINQDEAVAHEDVGLPSVQLSVRTPFSPRGMSSSAEATGSPTIPPLLSPVDPPAHFPSLQARQFPSAPTTRCSPSSKPTAICRPAESAAISTTAKDADPPPQSDSHLGSHAARSSPNLSATAKLPSAPLAPNPRPSAEQPANSSSSLSGSLQAQPPPTTNSAPEILVLSSSSERGDSDLDSGSDSDIEIISPPAPLSRRDVAEESRLEWKGREERDLKRSEREAAELRGQVEMRQAKEETETRQLGAPTREEESIREEHGRAERERAKQEALREKMRETEEGQSLDRERASERERTEAERAEGERTEAERSEREKLDNEQLGRGQKLEGERRLRLTEDRESEAERARAAAEAYRKQRTEQDAEEEDRRRRAREEEDRVRQEQDREEEEELDRFCQVELPRLETETQKFRSTLREPVKEKWDEVLGHIIASEGVSTTKEYEERVERAKLALADVFEPERWSDEQCEPSLPEGQAQKVEGTAREGLTQDFEMDFVSETSVISGADSVTKEITEERFKQDQFNKSRPYHRQIAGPSYDRDDEFPKMIQASVQRRERAWKERHPTGNPPLRDSYKGLYEQMISDANSSEYPPDHRPSIRIIPLGDAKNTDYSSPEFELCYTNRVIYADGIVPDQAPGCACIGDCGSPQNRAGCACRARQIAASKTRVNGGQRSGLQNFAYDSNGLLDEKIFNSDDPIIECNSQCGCSDDCINRVVGNKKSISVDIFRTLDKGWGIRNPHSYSDVSAYVERTIRKGEPLGIYAGELITHEEAEMRDKLIYSKTHRCYTYCLDAWPVGEDYKALAPKADADKMKVSSTKSSHKVAPRPIPTAKKSRSTNSQQRDSKRAVLRDEEDGDSDDDSFSGIYNVDAFSYGNWTRFANHVCVDYNMVPRCVYVDEINVTRPLWTYVARRDIKPGEELTISYFSGEEPRLYGKMDLKTWKKMADELRREQPKNFRCYCGKDLCRGVMFGTGKAEFYDPPE